MSKNILVIGGTGTTGSALAQILKQKGADFTVLCRSEEKAGPLRKQGIKCHIGTLDDKASVEPVLENAHTVYLLTGPSPDQVKVQNGLIDQAKSAGVKRIVKLSAVGAQTGAPINLGDWHGRTEDHLKDSGLDYTILQPHSFMQNLLMSIPTIKEQGAIYMAMGDAKIPLIDARDIAEFSAKVLMEPGHDGETYVLTGGEGVTYHEVAAALSKATGKSIQYFPIEYDAYNKAMKDAGVPEWLADDLTNMARFWTTGQGVTVSPDFEKIMGKKPRTIHDFVRDYAGYFR